jgi:hypothetical protein
MSRKNALRTILTKSHTNKPKLQPPKPPPIQHKQTFTALSKSRTANKKIQLSSQQKDARNARIDKIKKIGDRSSNKFISQWESTSLAKYLSVRPFVLSIRKKRPNKCRHKNPLKLSVNAMHIRTAYIPQESMNHLLPALLQYNHQSTSLKRPNVQSLNHFLTIRFGTQTKTMQT